MYVCISGLSEREYTSLWLSRREYKSSWAYTHCSGIKWSFHKLYGKQHAANVLLSGSECSLRHLPHLALELQLLKEVAAGMCEYTLPQEDTLAAPSYYTAVWNNLWCEHCSFFSNLFPCCTGCTDSSCATRNRCCFACLSVPILHSRWVGTYKYLNTFRQKCGMGTGLAPFYSTCWSS